jgi:manganese/zinc/iron transport system permease protein
MGLPLCLLSLDMDYGLFLAQVGRDSITDRRLQWPSLEQWQRVLLLQDYNTRLVIFGVALLGAAAGLVGSFTILRKRALLGDALSHASLPGIAAAFMLASALGLDAKALPILLVGATLSGLLGIAVVILVRNHTRLKEDAGLGIALSVFFGAGMALMGVVQQMDTGHAAGLESFIYGKTASMTAQDAQWIAWASCIAFVGCGLLYKEFKLLCFDEGFAGARGLPVGLLDLSLMALVVVVIIVGLQAVGLILMVALMVIPAAAGRFWTDKLWLVAGLASLLGGVGGVLGAASSALFPRLPSGAMIVLACTGLFAFSLVFGSSRGVFVRGLRRYKLNNRVKKQHLLRGLFELLEAEPGSGADRDAVKALSRSSVSIEQLMNIRSWTRAQLLRTIAAAERDGFVLRGAQAVRLTQSGYAEAARLTRQHRLWELYLITHADVAPGRVDRDADDIEHVLDPEVVDQLETLLEQEPVRIQVPASPHGESL